MGGLGMIVSLHVFVMYTVCPEPLTVMRRAFEVNKTSTTSARFTNLLLNAWATALWPNQDLAVLVVAVDNPKTFSKVQLPACVVRCVWVLSFLVTTRP